jgi:Invasion associated locus B (IalB) protein
MIPSRRHGRLALAIMTLCVCGMGVARAAEPALLGEFGSWAAYTYQASDTKVCYISAAPKSSEPKVKRDPAFFLVSNMPGRKVKGEVSTIIGYPFKKESKVLLTIDDTKFELYTNGDGAWADNSDTEKKIVSAMKSGNSLKVAGTSWKGTKTVDSYGLEGISAALAKIDEACRK